MRRRLTISLVLLAMLPTAIGCSSSGSGDQGQGSDAPTGYQAVPDDQLFSAVSRLPTVTGQTLYWKSDFASGDNYRGTVTLRSGLSQAQVTKVYDHVITILRHGHWAADYSAVFVASGATEPGGGAADLVLPEDYEQRYGPQTGEKGWPPPFVPN